MKKSVNAVKGIMIMLLWVILLFCVSCGGEGRATDMNLARVEGNVGVRDETEKEVEAEENLGLYSGYRIDTEQTSYAWVNLDQVKLAKIDQQTAVKIQKSGKALELQLSSGSIYFNIREPLEEDETLEIRTSTMAVGIRGTIGWVEVIDDAQMKVNILEGTVQCSVTDSESGETVTANVSQGETAILINDPENSAIVVDKIEEAAIPEFVSAELQEDSQAAERVEEATGIVPVSGGEDSGDDPESEGGEAETESGAEESDAVQASDEASSGNTAELLQEFLDKELVPQYGYADLSARERGFSPVNDFFEYEVDNAWTGISGIGEARILDLDGDGTDEMLVVIIEGQRITMEVYEIENDAPVKKGEIVDDQMEQIGMGDDCFYEKVFSLVEAEGITYLFFTSQFSGFVTGDGYFSYVKLYRYDGEQMYASLAIMQAYLGSAGFEYDAFRYDENGNVLSQEVIYDEEDENYNEAYCHGRMEALFGEYGIAVGENATMTYYDGIFDTFLASGTVHEEILNLRMEGDLQDGQAMYRFNSR